ncbi:sulfurtransferase, partial [Enterococcus hirae]
RFKPASQIRADMQSLQGPEVIHMCGSGVTACSNIFAAELAGLGTAKLYVGSWSEWIRDPSRPVGFKR